MINYAMNGQDKIRSFVSFICDERNHRVMRIDPSYI